MHKKDPIFWGATGIFILAMVIFALTQNQLWLTLMIGSYLLRPTLASLGVTRRYVDERQMSIHYRSSNIAFVVMLITCIIIAAKLNAEGNHDWEFFNMVIMVGLATKALLRDGFRRNDRIGICNSRQRFYLGSDWHCGDHWHPIADRGIFSLFT